MDDLRQPAGDNNALRAKRHLVWRAAATAGLIVALLAALVVFEHRHSSDNAANEPERARAAKAITRTGPSPSDRAPSESQSTSLASLAKDAAKQSSDSSALRETTLPDTMLPKAAPEESTQPTKSESAPSISTRPPPGKTQPLVVEQPVSKAPPTQIDKAAPPPAATPAAKSAVPAGTGAYIVQLGVFSNPVNAEELRARLTQNGIPSYLETRVRLGPFDTRQDALAAQEKLRRLGMETGMVVANRK